MPAIDLGTFNSLFDLKEMTIAKLARLSKVSRATIRNILKTGRCTEKTLHKISGPLGTTADCLIAHDRANTIICDVLKEEYKDLLRDVLHSDAFVVHAEETVGLFDADVLAFAHQVKKSDLDSCNLSPNGRNQVHTELCRDGLFYKKPNPHHPTIFKYCCRIWSLDQLTDNLELRIGIEILCAKRALKLIARDPAKSLAIQREMKRLLDGMEELKPSLESNPDDKIADLALRYDSRFHRAWAGDAPDHRASMGRAIFGHGQLTHHYKYEMAKARRKSNFPAKQTTLSDLALYSLNDLRGIYDAFVAIDDPTDSKQVDPLLDLIEQHPRNNWDRIAAIHQFNCENA
ncbi:hypothetical protein FF011L_12480 [Roseimaritima multifibrata]|uniref:Uncharacterized protein n=1 Tax=Roseimaritima multifibrata TaxID=1930274 RepID=A0A517MC92_9BACT|nr:hypothetical protein [Roseimaritima multifibrata]QDS92502.1 hypothetical protein FF011L_12480 [Roseimaritima multifibrata]